MPKKIDELVKEIKERNPSYDDAKAFATAWSVYCKHIEPGSAHCKKDSPSEYLKGQGKGKKAKKWIQKAIKEEGALRKHFGIGEGETIPTGKLKSEQKKLQDKADKSDAETKLLRRINLALTLRSKEVPPPKGKKKAMGETRRRLIRLAHEKPELRVLILPLLRSSG